MLEECHRRHQMLLATTSKNEKLIPPPKVKKKTTKEKVEAQKAHIKATMSHHFKGSPLEKMRQGKQ